MFSKATLPAATGRRPSSSTASGSAASTLAASTRAAWAASTLRASAAATRGLGVSASGVVPTLLAALGIAGFMVLQRSVPPRWVGLRWERRQPAPIPTMAPPAATTPTRPATEDCTSHAYEQDRHARSLGLDHLRDSRAGIQLTETNCITTERSMS